MSSESDPPLHRVSIDVPLARIEEATTILWERGARGVEIQDDPEAARAPAPRLEPGWARAIAYLTAPAARELDRAAGEILPGARVSKEIFTDRSWVESLRRAIQPASIGRRLAVAPPWDVPAFPDGVSVVLLDPGLAFGTGTHPTTWLCLEELERLAESSPPRRVLDVGCGTGVLAIAAAVLLPECRADAIDSDPEARRAALENARTNGVARRVRVLDCAIGDVAVGSRNEESAPPNDEPGGPYDLVLANLYGPILIELAPEFARVASPRSRLVVSGLTADEESAVTGALSASGFEVERRLERDFWILLSAALHDRARSA